MAIDPAMNTTAAVSISDAVRMNSIDTSDRFDDKDIWNKDTGLHVQHIEVNLYYPRDGEEFVIGHVMTEEDDHKPPGED